MANDLNQCNFIGRLGADPETRYMPSGEPVVNIRIVVGWKRKEKEGAEWLSLVAFGRKAEIVSQYCRKGSQIFASCHAKTEEYEKNGEKRYATKFVIDRLQLLGRVDVISGHGVTQPAAGEGGAFCDIEDDIPF